MRKYIISLVVLLGFTFSEVIAEQQEENFTPQEILNAIGDAYKDVDGTVQSIQRDKMTVKVDTPKSINLGGQIEQVNSLKFDVTRKNNNIMLLRKGANIGAGALLSIFKNSTMMNQHGIISGENDQYRISLTPEFAPSEQQQQQQSEELPQVSETKLTDKPTSQKSTGDKSSILPPDAKKIIDLLHQPIFQGLVGMAQSPQTNIDAVQVSFLQNGINDQQALVELGENKVIINGITVTFARTQKQTAPIHQGTRFSLKDVLITLDKLISNAQSKDAFSFNTKTTNETVSQNLKLSSPFLKNGILPQDATTLKLVDNAIKANVFDQNFPYTITLEVNYIPVEKKAPPKEQKSTKTLDEIKSKLSEAQKDLNDVSQLLQSLIKGGSTDLSSRQQQDIQQSDNPYITGINSNAMFPNPYGIQQRQQQMPMNNPFIQQQMYSSNMQMQGQNPFMGRSLF